MIQLELCRSNSVGSIFHAPQVVETWSVATREEADTEIAKPRPNGYYVREAEPFADWELTLANK